MNEENPVQQRLAEEEELRKRTDENGIEWTKVYFGGGSHYRNWLSQFIELKGEENVEVEEMDPSGFQCYEESGEKMYRIWIKDSDEDGETGEYQDESGNIPFYDSMDAY